MLLNCDRLSTYKLRAPNEFSWIGFGVVCGEDNKRFKSRSGDTVRLVDLLDAAKERMETQLREREAEGKTPLKVSEYFFGSCVTFLLYRREML